MRWALLRVSFGVKDNLFVGIEALLKINTEGQTKASCPFQVSIDKVEINRLHLKKYTGPVELIRNEQAFECAIRELKKESVLGFDTETRPAFRKGESYMPSLVQLGGENKVYLFQLALIKNSTKLFGLLSNPDILKVGVAMDYDIRQLQEIREFEASGFQNLETIAEQLGIKKNGLRNLAAIALGVRISKSEQRSNWSRDPLTRQQVIYAATDAWVSREIYLKFIRFLNGDGAKPSAD